MGAPPSHSLLQYETKREREGEDIDLSLSLSLSLLGVKDRIG